MPEPTPYRADPMYRYLMVLTICATVGLQTWQTLFNNFAVDAAALTGRDIGIIQSVREIPGFLALLVVYALLIVREHRLSALSVLALGTGLAATGIFPSFAGLTFTTLLMSFGFHYFETTNQSLTLQYFDTHRSPLVFGRLRAAAAISSICISAIIYVTSPVADYATIYLVAGGAITVAALWGLTTDPSRSDLKPQRKQMVLKWRYSLYYLLTFLAGARRQVFIVFSVLLLVERFSFSVRDVALLFVINNGINFWISPWIGRAIVRFGERRVLSLEYGALIVIFLAYAITDSAWVAGLLYVLDHIFFNFAIAIRTFFQKIGAAEDIAPSMAVGFTINHIAAVVLPALGGLLWMIDYRIPFVAGAVLSACSLIAAQWIPRHPAA